MRIERLTKDNVTIITLDDLKQRGNIVGDYRDNELAIALFRAVCQVEDIANVSLSGNTVKIVTEDNVNFQKLYYHPITEIEVKDMDGNTISFITDSENSYVKLSEAVQCIITYTTAETNHIRKQELRQCVLDLALAYFDGLPTNQILINIPRSLC